MLRCGKRRHLPAIFCLMLALAACGGDDAPETSTGGSTGDSPQTGQPTTDLKISGSPQREAKVGQDYTFQPTATTTSGSGKLSFQVSSKPGWASFNTQNGRLTGQPQQQDIGTYGGIRITVTDDEGNSSSLGPFSINVVEYGAHSVTLSWLPPLENEDGSALTDLAGYKVRYGQRSGDYNTEINVTNVGLTTWIVEGLVPSTYFFVVTAYNASGIESAFSDEAHIVF
jgi:hypothetical protein